MDTITGGMISTGTIVRAALRRLSLDARQQAVRTRLEAIRAAVSRGEHPRGLYIHGSVGSGKTMLMDAFYSALVRQNSFAKVCHREHWTPFLRTAMRPNGHAPASPPWPLSALHRLFGGARGQSHIAASALALRQRTRVLCLDEMQILDVADARAASSVLCALLGRQTRTKPVVLVATSNTHPAALYTRGDAFALGLEALMSSVDVVALDSADYRLQASRDRPLTWYSPLGALTTEKMDHVLFPNGVQQLLPPDLPATRNAEERATISIDGRHVVVGRRIGETVVATFDAMCRTPLSTGDYIALLVGGTPVRQLVLTGVPVLAQADADAARRLILLVDVVYDRGIELSIEAECDGPLALFTDDVFADPRERAIVRRTVSRLLELTGSA